MPASPQQSRYLASKMLEPSVKARSIELSSYILYLTLPGLKARGFLRHFSLNIPIALSSQADYSGHYRCVVISPQKCFGRRLSPSPGVGFYISSDLVILPYSFVKMDLLFYLTMEKSRPTKTGFSTQFSDKTRAIAPPLFALQQALCIRHCQDAISLRMSVKTLKPTVLYSRKVYAYLSLLQGKDSKPPFLVTRLGPRICISGYLESKL